MSNVIKSLFSSTQSHQKIEIVEITPEMAEQILSFNTDNFRSVDKRRVERYANDIRSGLWELTGDTIKINGNTLIDGQHRLMAVVASGRTIRTAIAWNVAESAIHIDRGKPRTIAQWLKHLGMKDANNIAATALLALQHERGKWGRVRLQVEEYQDTDIINYARDHYESLRASVNMAARSKGLLYRSIAGAIIHIGCNRKIPDEDELVVWFWDGVANGNGLEENDPPLALRNRLVASKLSKNAQISTHYMRWIATIAWNKAATGNEATAHSLRVRSIGPNKQATPNHVIGTDEI